MAFGDFTVTRASTKNVLGSAGLYVSVANNVPAFEFNTDGTYRGLLVEPGATNLALHSQAFDDAYWSKALGTITANATTAPDGTLTADKYIVNSGEPTNSPIIRLVTLSPSTTYVLSLFVKKADYNTAGIRIFTVETGFSTTNFNLDTKTADGNRIQDVGNGWFRIWAVLTTLSTVTNSQIQLIRDAEIRDGTSGIFIWQAQLETGSVATSPIVTTAGTASRVADVVSLTGASSLIGATEGTLYAEVDIARAVVGSIIAIDDGDLSDFIGFEKLANLTIRVVIRRANATSATIITSSAVSLGVHKIALGYKDADYALYIDGVQAGTSTNATDYPATTLSRVILTNSQYGQFNDRHRSVALFPTRLANATLASMTA
jgi:hypothetical protein